MRNDESEAGGQPSSSDVFDEEARALSQAEAVLARGNETAHISHHDFADLERRIR